MACVVLFHITKPGNVESIYFQKNVVGILNHENNITRKIKPRKLLIIMIIYVQYLTMVTWLLETVAIKLTDIRLIDGSASALQD